ncbi:MAG: DUF4199 domain-containing protein [Lewinella sp.]
MKSTILKYGLRAFATMLVLFVLAFLLGKGQSYTVQEILGYLTIVISLSLVYFAIRHYRDEVNGGQLSFGQGLWLGVIISACAGIGSAIADAIYTTVIYPDFITEYTQHELDKMKASLPPAEFETASAELLAQIEWMGNPAMLAIVMFVTVLLIGFIVSLVSSLLLRSQAPSGT